MVGERLNTQALGVVVSATFVPRITTNFERLPAVPRAACARLRLIPLSGSKLLCGPECFFNYARVNQSIDHERNFQGSHDPAHGAIHKVGGGSFMGTS